MLYYVLYSECDFQFSRKATYAKWQQEFLQFGLYIELLYLLQSYTKTRDTLIWLAIVRSLKNRQTSSTCCWLQSEVTRSMEIKCYKHRFGRGHKFRYFFNWQINTERIHGCYGMIYENRSNDKSNIESVMDKSYGPRTSQ